MENREAKLKMGPLWDADWSLGLTAQVDGNWVSAPFQPRSDEEIWGAGFQSYMQLLSHLLKSKLFRNTVKQELNSLRTRLSLFKDAVSFEIDRIKYAQEDYFKKWQLLDSYTGVVSIALGSWEAEVNYVKSFFDERLNWFYSYIDNITNND